MYVYIYNIYIIHINIFLYYVYICIYLVYIYIDYVCMYIYIHDPAPPVSCITPLDPFWVIPSISPPESASSHEAWKRPEKISWFHEN